MRVALDTNRYADLMRGDDELASQLASCEWVGVPFVVVAELRAGFSAGKKRSDNERNLTRFLGRPGVRVLWPGDVTTRIYASIYRQLRSDGFPIPTNDIWIAAISLENEAALVTRDPHFRKIPELLVIGPS